MSKPVTLDDLKRWALYTVLAIVGACALTWIGDFIAAHARGTNAVGSVHVNQFMVTPLKGGKAEYDYVGADDVSCSHSLFPQLGHNPCWYLERNKNNMQEN